MCRLSRKGTPYPRTYLVKGRENTIFISKPASLAFWWFCLRKNEQCTASFTATFTASILICLVFLRMLLSFNLNRSRQWFTWIVGRNKSPKQHVGYSEIDSSGVQTEHPQGALMRDTPWRGLKLYSILFRLRQNAGAPMEICWNCASFFLGIATHEKLHRNRAEILLNQVSRRTVIFWWDAHPNKASDEDFS